MTHRSAPSPVVAALATFALLASALLGCSTAPSDARSIETPPDATSFPPVAAMFVQACGSLDCHGTVARNLRLYGDTSLRWSPLDVPSTLIPTTPNEVSADFASVVGLEPELTSQVVASGGANPERLTLVRKARGTESHAGGAVVVPGDARDVCMTSWLAGKSDASACATALNLP
jgi:hypothetical protein